MELINVDSIIKKPFSSRNYDEKLEIVKANKPAPKLSLLSSKYKSKNKEFTRHFNPSSYQNINWLSGCSVWSKQFCWPCLLFSTENSVWTKIGFADLNHFSSATKKHEKCSAHVQALLKYRMFGKQRIDTLLNTQQQVNVTRHNEQVKKKQRNFEKAYRYCRLHG